MDFLECTFLFMFLSTRQLTDSHILTRIFLTHRLETCNLQSRKSNLRHSLSLQLVKIWTFLHGALSTLMSFI